MKFSVIVPSKTVRNATASISAVRQHEPDAEVLLAWAAHPAGLIPTTFHETRMRVVAEPFVFARNVNIGIKDLLHKSTCANHLSWGHYPCNCDGSPDSDWAGVVILNDDAILQTPGGFSLLAQATRENPEYGIISAVTNCVGNRAQMPRGIGLREEPRMVCFVCVYIPRTTIEKVGLLDERFVGYGLDDDDYCLRIRKTGLKIGIHDGCFVDHLSLKSSYRGDPTTPSDFRPNLELFKQKWGHDNFGVPA